MPDRLIACVPRRRARAVALLALAVAAAMGAGCASKPPPVDPAVAARNGVRVGRHYFNRAQRVALTAPEGWELLEPRLVSEGAWSRVAVARAPGAQADLVFASGLAGTTDEERLARLAVLAFSRPGYSEIAPRPGHAPQPLLGRRSGVRRAGAGGIAGDGELLLAVRGGDGFLVEVFPVGGGALAAGAAKILDSFREAADTESLDAPLPPQRLPAPPPAPPPPPTYAYSVKRGDTLGTIARAETGDTRNWRELAQLNDLTEKSPLAVGQVLRIPESLRLSPEERTRRRPKPQPQAERAWVVEPAEIMGARAASASVYDEPKAGARVVARLPRGTPLDPAPTATRAAGWMAIELPGGGVGWISALDVSSR